MIYMRRKSFFLSEIAKVEILNSLSMFSVNASFISTAVNCLAKFYHRYIINL